MSSNRLNYDLGFLGSLNLRLCLRILNNYIYFLALKCSDLTTKLIEPNTHTHTHTKKETKKEN